MILGTVPRTFATIPSFFLTILYRLLRLSMYYVPLLITLALTENRSTAQAPAIGGASFIAVCQFVPLVLQLYI